MSRQRHTARVAHVTTVHHLRDPRIFHKEVGSLRDAGYDVHLVARHTRSETVEGVPVTALPPAQGRYRRLLQLADAYRAARALQADVYHLHDPELIPVGSALKRALGAKVIYDMHEDYRGHGIVEGRVIRALERWCFTWVDHVVLAEEGYASIVAGSRAPRTVILNYFRPRDSGPAQPKAVPGDPFELLYTGVQSVERGLSVMLDLATLVRQKALPWHLNLVGICFLEKDRRQAEECLRAGRLEDIVHWEGRADYVPWPAMLPYYRAAHVGLALLQPHPNFVGTIPTKFYEYLHFGLPILCSDFPQ